MSEREKMSFDEAKKTFLRFADVVRKAETADEMRALLLADTQAPYHSYDILALMTVAENIGYDLCECMSEPLDFDGSPQ